MNNKEKLFRSLWVRLFLAALLFFQSLAPLQVYAGTNPPDDEGEKTTGEQTCGDSSTDEPIDTSTGNNYFTERRLLVSCPGIPLELDLKYQSKTTQPEGLLGKNWLHSYEWFLDVQANRAVIYTGSGNKYFFDKNTDGVFQTPKENNWTIQAEGTGHRVSLPGGLDYRFPAGGQLGSVRDAWGNELDCRYSSNDCLEAVVHSNGRRILFSNEWHAATATWRIAEISVPNGSSLSFTYNGDGQFTQVVEQVDASCHTSRYQYADGCLTNKVNGAGFEYTFGYETEGGSLNGKGTYLSVDGYYEHEVDYVDADTTDVSYSLRGTEQIYRYSRTGGKLGTKYGPAETVAQTANLGMRYSYALNGVDKTEETLFDDTVDETFSEWMLYDDEHNMTNHAVSYCTTNPVHQLSMRYDSTWQLPSGVADAEGNRVETLYTNGSPLAVKTFYSATESHDTHYAYTTNGLVQAVTNATGHVVCFGYDAAGNQISMAAELGPVVTNTYDALGFVKSMEILSESGTSSGRATQYDTDAKGRVTQIIFADGATNSFAYNALGYLTNSTDRAGRATDYTYAPTEKLTSVTRYLEQGGSNAPVRTSYNLDKQVNVLCITEPRGRYVESYQLDIQDRVTSVTNIENQVMDIEYGVGGFVRKVTRFDGSSITNTYDSAGRKNSVVYNPGSASPVTIDYSYYPDSELKTIADAASALTNTYDNLNRLVSVTSSVPSVSSVVNYRYDPVGNVTNSVVSAGGSQASATAYSYDVAERLEEISTPDAGVFEYIYNPNNGRVASVSNTVSGITTSYAYDLLDRATNIAYTASDGSLIRSLEYAYDAAGMITNKVQASGNGQEAQVAYEYDSIDRLVSESSSVNSAPLRDIQYNYDLAGNRTSVIAVDGIGDPVTNTYTLGTGNRLSSWGVSGPASYDAAGNTTNLNSVALDWDERYRLKSVDDASSFVQYTYDVFGRKVSRIEGSTTNYFIYDGNQIVADVDASGNLLRTYTYGPGIDNILSMTAFGASATNTYFYLKDHQNTVVALTDNVGSVVESYDYDAYGNTKVFNASGTELSASAYGNRYAFQGREIDWETGLMYFRARWYNSEIGRWLSKDPIGIAGGLNQYEFCGSNPVNNVDPSGHGWMGWAGGFMQAAGGFAMVAGAVSGNLGLFAAGAALAIGGEALKQIDDAKTVNDGVNKANDVVDNVKDRQDRLNDLMDEIGCSE